jgi:outer membrane lipase/esterase
MRKTSFALALLSAAVLTACGGGGNGPRAGNQTPTEVKFASQVSFGDSLSDVGSYAVGGIKALGGGQFTINGDNTAVNPELTGRSWHELISAQLNLPKPCPAQTGIEGTAPGFNVPIAFNTNCTNYAQGGSRVTNPVGPRNKAVQPELGLTTVPVVTQIANHLAKAGGKFNGNELVTVTAGGNDMLFLTDDLKAKATAAGEAAGAQAFAASLATQLAAGAKDPATAVRAIGLAIQTEAARPGHTDQTVVGAAVQAAAQAGNLAAAQSSVYLPMVAKAQADAKPVGEKAGADYAAANAANVVAEMTKAGADLVKLVKEQLVAKGANYVVLNNLPDIASTPAVANEAASTQTLVKTAVDAFNAQLKAYASSEPKVLYVDLWGISHDQVTNPGPYGLTNTSTPACGPNALKGSSLVCNAGNLIAGDVSHYMFADTVHPTPFEYKLIARYVLEQMAVKGWL